MCALKVLGHHAHTFQSGHPVRKLNLFATCIYSSSLVIQNKRRGLVHLFDFYFPIKKGHIQTSLVYFHITSAFLRFCPL